MIVFFCKDLTGQKALLEEDEYQHCIKVLRHKIEDQIYLSDGSGTTAKAILTHIGKREAETEIIKKSQSEPKEGQIHLLVAPPKNRSRWEWLVEKSVELGVDSLTSLTTERSERTRINEARTQKIMRSAALQSLRPFHPKYLGHKTLDSVLSTTPSDTACFLAHYHPTHPDLTTIDKVHSNAHILIGPEGDFTSQEVSRCNESGYESVNISEHRLRTETAAISVITLLKSMGY